MQITKESLCETVRDNLHQLCLEYASIRATGVVGDECVATLELQAQYHQLQDPKPFGAFVLWLAFALGDVAIDHVSRAIRIEVPA